MWFLFLVHKNQSVVKMCVKKINSLVRVMRICRIYQPMFSYSNNYFTILIFYCYTLDEINKMYYTDTRLVVGSYSFDTAMCLVRLTVIFLVDISLQGKSSAFVRHLKRPK